MSLENAVKFIERMAEDEAFRESFQAAGSEEARRELVRESGLGFTDEEYGEAMQMILKAAEGGDELSDDDLEHVAGGVNFGGLFGIAQKITSGLNPPIAAAYGAVWNGGDIFQSTR